MHAKLMSSLLLLCAIGVEVTASPVSTTNPFTDLEKRKTCPGSKGCSSKGGSQWCWDRGCDGNCMTDDMCGGFAECNIHFNNCRRTIEYKIARDAGMIVEHPNGTSEWLEGADEHVKRTLEALKK